MNRTYAGELAKKVTVQQLRQMFAKARATITDWRRQSRVNSGMTIGATFNILSNGINATNKPKDNAIVTNMILEFGEFLPNYEPQTETPKELQHQEPVAFSCVNELQDYVGKPFAVMNCKNGFPAGSSNFSYPKIVSVESLQSCFDIWNRWILDYFICNIYIFDGCTLTFYIDSLETKECVIKNTDLFIKPATLDLNAINFVIGLPNV